MKQITQKDIASALNLSRVTITKALKDHPDISSATIKKVKEYAEHAGYIPNLVSRNLSAQKTYTIGFVVPKLFNSFCASAIEAANETALENGYQLIPMISYENPDAERKAIQTLLSMRVDGIIIDVTENTTSLDIFHQVENQNVPLIFIDRFIEGTGFNKIVTNDFEASKEATTHAINSGHDNIAFLATRQHLNIGKQRLNGHISALEEQGIKVNKDMIFYGDTTQDFGYQTFMKLFNCGNLPATFICSSLTMAIGVHKAVRESGINIPNNLSIITFGDIEMASILSPPPAIFHVPIRKMAKKALEMIIRKNKEIDFKISDEIIFKSSMYISNSNHNKNITL